MNILEITTFLRGGAGAFLTRLSCQLKKRGHSIETISSGKVGELIDWDELLDELKLNKISHYKLNFFSRDNEIFWTEVEKLANLLKDKDYDVIHVHAGVPALACHIAKQMTNKEIPIIATFHSWGKDRPEWMNICDAWAFNRCEKVIFDSNEYMTFGKQKGISIESKVIYPGLMIDKNVYEIPRYEVRRKLIKKLNIPNSSVIITNLAEITERKGQIDLVRALRHICDVRDDVYLCLIGENRNENYYNNLIKTINQLSLDDKVFFMGWIENPYETVAVSDIFVFPSYSEGLGLAIVEAISLGVPAIFSSIEGTKDIARILENSCFGTFQPSDAKRIADLVLEVLHKENTCTTKQIDNSAEKVNDIFSFDKTVKSYEKEMIELVYKNKY